MKTRIALMALLSSAASFAAIDGTVVNMTSGKPQAGAVVTLVELGQGMQNLGSVKSDASGKFSFQKDANPATPYLIQALHQGVTYNRMLPPGSAGQPVELQVYDASAKASNAKVTQDMILLERSGGQLIVNETVIFSNGGDTTFQSPDGTLQFQTPPGADNVRMRVTAPQGMPVNREPEKGSAPNTWVVRYPIKPGETRIDLNYAVPATGDSTTFAGRVLHGGGPVRFVAPQGVKLESSALTDLGPEPRTQASVYELKGSAFSIKVSGEGQLRAPASESSAGQQRAEGEETDTPGIDIVKARIFQRVIPVTGLALAMLAVGFVWMYNRGGAKA